MSWWLARSLLLLQLDPSANRLLLFAQDPEGLRDAQQTC
jgi:hypothetical protein